jgi:hypothetical protein
VEVPEVVKGNPEEKNINNKASKDKVMCVRT